MTIQQAKDIAHRVKGSETDIAIALLEANRDGYKEAVADTREVIDSWSIIDSDGNLEEIKEVANNGRHDTGQTSK